MRVKVHKQEWYPATRVYDIERNQVAELMYPHVKAPESASKIIRKALEGSEGARILVDAAIDSMIDESGERIILESPQAEGGIIVKAQADDISIISCSLNRNGDWTCSPRSVEPDSWFYGDLAYRKPDLYYDRLTGKLVKNPDLSGQPQRYIPAEHDDQIMKYSEALERAVERMNRFYRMLSNAEYIIENHPSYIDELEKEFNEKHDPINIARRVASMLGTGTDEAYDFLRSLFRRRFGYVPF